jgi:phage portal protein BeeE
MVGHGSNTSTYASAEQFFLHHAVHTIRPWHRLFEASIDASLLSDADADAGYYSAFFDGELLRANAKDRAEVYARGLGAGGTAAYVTPNEVRAWEEMDPIEGGDTLPHPAGAARQEAANGP